MYNSLLLLAILIILFVTVNYNDNNTFYLSVPIMLVVTTNIVFAVYLPAILRHFRFIKSEESIKISKTNTLDERSKTIDRTTTDIETKTELPL